MTGLEVDQNRVLLYRLLSQAMSYPDHDIFERLRRLVENVEIEKIGDQNLSLGRFLDQLNNLTKLPLDQVQGEYTRLFINAFPKTLCPPYESIYREGVLLGQTAEDVFQYYCRWGVCVENDDVDHAGAELEFLAYLLTLDEPEALAEADQFLNEHVLLWLPRLAADMELESQLSFYRELGRLMTNILGTNEGRQ